MDLLIRSDREHLSQHRGGRYSPLLVAEKKIQVPFHLADRNKLDTTQNLVPAKRAKDTGPSTVTSTSRSRKWNHYGVRVPNTSNPSNTSNTSNPTSRRGGCGKRTTRRYTAA